MQQETDNKMKVTPIELNGKTSHEKIKEITDKLTSGVTDLFDSDKYKNFLTTMTKFHHYSLNNQMLIYKQCPHATYVASFQAWKKNFERNVKQGEKGIKIFVPINTKIDVVVTKKDENGNVVYDADGNPVKETIKEDKLSFTIGHVFDVSQTEGKELPELAKDLSGSIENYDELVNALISCSPVPIRFDNIPDSNVKGYFSLKNKEIVVREGMSNVHSIKTMVHEISHALLHSDKSNELDRNTEEVQAESIAYVVCNYLGLDTSDYSFGYIAGWSKDKDATQLKESLTVIRDTSTNIIKKISKGEERVREKELSIPNEKKPSKKKVKKFDRDKGAR